MDDSDFDVLPQAPSKTTLCKHMTWIQSRTFFFFLNHIFITLDNLQYWYIYLWDFLSLNVIKDKFKLFKLAWITFINTYNFFKAPPGTKDNTGYQRHYQVPKTPPGAKCFLFVAFVLAVLGSHRSQFCYCWNISLPYLYINSLLICSILISCHFAIKCQWLMAWRE